MLETYRYSAAKFPVEFFTFLLTGSDVVFFLQNQSTFNIDQLNIQQFHLISFLDPQGRVEFYGWLLKTSDNFQLLVPTQLKDAGHIRLEKFLISEDVTITPVGLETWSVVLGPKARQYVSEGAFKGLMLEEEAFLTKEAIELPEVSQPEVKLWRELNGWPDFQGQGFKSEIINNLRLYDLSVSPNKGCYPGQETVSKIATRRGAAYSPVLLETTVQVSPGVVHAFEKKIGEIDAVNKWQDHYYLSASLLRDFRVAGMKVSFTKDEQEIESLVRYYPLLSGSPQDKALELFYAASDFFKIDDYTSAEDYLRQAIALDPEFADAYESLGVMLGRLNRYEEAIELMDHLSKVDPASVLAHTNKSLFLMKLGKIEEAEQEKSIATIKSFQKFGSEAKLKDQIAKEKEAQEEEWSKREGMFRQVLEIDEEDTLANYGLGSIAVERREWETAITHLEKVLKADPNYSVAYLALGKAYKGSGMKSKAAEIWKDGISIAAKKGDLMPANQMQSELQNL